MEDDQLLQEYEEFKKQFPSFGPMAVLTRSGEILLSSHDDFLTNEEAQALMDAWMNRKSAITVGNDRFPILKWDELQFAARNVQGRGAIVGCITKSNRFCVALFKGSGNLIQATVDLNRWSWNRV